MELLKMTTQLLDMENKYDISNIVLSGNFKIGTDKLDLKRILREGEGFEKKERFPALIWKNGGSETMILHNNGTFVVTGVKKIIDGDRVISTVKKELEKYGIKISGEERSVVNIVAHGELKYEKSNGTEEEIEMSIDLNKAVTTMRNARYEPEIFPGLVYYTKMGDKKGPTCLLFDNGKIVFNGAKTNEDIDQCISKIKEEIKKNDLLIN